MQLKLFEPGDFLTIREASDWASKYLRKNVTNSNIAYLVNYGRIDIYNETENSFFRITSRK